VHAVGFQQGLVEGGEVQSLGADLFDADIAGRRTRSDFETSPSSLTLASNLVPMSMVNGLG
jgi:hypothetical protein